MRHAFAAPAIAAERAGKLAAVYGREHGSRQVPNRLECFAKDCGRAEQQTVCRRNLRGNLCRIRRHHIIGFYINIARLTDTFGNFFRKLGRIAVCADIRDNNSGLFILRNFAPFVIDGKQLVNMAVQHRAVAGTNHVDIQ